MQQIHEIMERYFWRLPSIIWTDIVEIAIISFLIYHILVWVKNTKAWSLLKGVVVIAIFLVLAGLFKMNTILWIAQNIVGAEKGAGRTGQKEYYFIADPFRFRKDGSRVVFRQDDQ